MEINHKNAMALWSSRYGRQCQKTKDFSGRKIQKSDFNNLKSQYCWNIDHILPLSQNGGSNKENLQITHCKTNQEKGDNFPTFKANNKNFQIVKHNGSYKVEEVKSTKSKFLDANIGLNYLKKLENKDSKTRWIGSILIKLENVSNPAVIEFIEKILGEDSIPYSINKGFSSNIYIAKNYNCPFKDDVSELLDICILLNTYLGYYFLNKKYMTKYQIYYQLKNYTNAKDMYHQAKLCEFNISYNHNDNSLYINNLVYQNTEAKENVPNLNFTYGYGKYNYSYTDLREKLSNK